VCTDGGPENPLRFKRSAVFQGFSRGVAEREGLSPHDVKTPDR
jgi:hypothetical protein